MSSELVLRGGARTFLDDGGRDLELARSLGGAAAPPTPYDGPPGPRSGAAPAAGAHLRLVDDRGEELGLAVADPDNDRLRVMVVAAERFPAIDAALLGDRKSVV